MPSLKKTCDEVGWDGKGNSQHQQELWVRDAACVSASLFHAEGWKSLVEGKMMLPGSCPMWLAA